MKRLDMLRRLLAEEERPAYAGMTDEAPPAKVPPAPRPTVNLSAMGGRSVTIDQEQFERLAEKAGVTGPDLDQTDYGRLVQAAKDGPRRLLDDVLSVRRPTSPVYRVRTAEGRTWTHTTLTQANTP